ncbi:MAG: ornithine cyclodeaminase family protein, partial [Gammaproteobacteria bacterium]|nr:ornithine cyclodeaminase family protein [Gammaproteobacteria bacterium]
GEGRITKNAIKGEIGNVIGGDVPGRSSDEQITIYKSCGNTAQDLYAAHAIYTKAVTQHKGTDIELQD